MSIFSIFLGLVILMILIFKKNNIIFVSLLASSIVILLSGINYVEGLSSWSQGFGDYIIKNFLLFAFSAIFGKFMEDSGAARAFANLIIKYFGKRLAPFGIILATSIMGYAGISSFVIVYTVFPIFVAVWKEADLPRYLIPGAIMASVASYTSGHFPGSASTLNMLTVNYLGTEPYAEPLIGTVSGLVVMILVFLYFNYEFKRSKRNNEHFESIESDKSLLKSNINIENKWLSLLPMLVLIFTLNFMSFHVYYSMLLGAITCWVFFRNNIDNVKETITIGFKNSISTIVNTASVVAFGVTVQATAGFGVFTKTMMNLPFNPIIAYAIATGVLAGISGSSTGASGITLTTLAPQFIDLGVPTNLIHRISTTSALTVDSLPHNGLVVTILTYCGVDHIDGYKAIFVTTVLINFIGHIVALLLALLLY